MATTVILSRQTDFGDIPHAVAEFDDYDEAVGYAADWPGRVHVVDSETGELVFHMALDVTDDGMPS